LSKSIYIF